MLNISASAWQKYIKALRKLENAAAERMTNYLSYIGGFEIEGNMQRAIDFAYALGTRYGEGAAALASELYDAIAAAEGVTVPAAIPAETAGYGEISAAVTAASEQAPSTVPSVVERYVKRAAADTILQNGLRDGAYAAWVPSGDTCAFCIMLASRGFERVSKETLRKGHAQHIHSNCDCQYIVAFGADARVEGYDPKRCESIYYDALNSSIDEGEGGSRKDAVNYIRRQQYAALPQAEKDRLNEIQRIQYRERKARTADKTK